MLIIDNREGKLIDLIKANPLFKIPYELKNLQIGDIIISSQNNPGKTIIVERKCMPDMIASIKDGRYKEQKIRLLAEQSNNIENTIICYLLEGNINELKYPSDKLLFHGSIVSSTFRDNIPLLRTGNLNETIDLIVRIHERMNKDITDFFKTKIQNNIEISQICDSDGSNTSNTSIISNINNTNNIIQTPNINNTYLNSIKKCKKDNITPKLWNQISLTNIPGVSTTIATKISEKYPTLKKLFKSYDECESDDKRFNLLSEIMLTNDSGKSTRRLGNIISKRVYEYLYLEEISVPEHIMNDIE